ANGGLSDARNAGINAACGQYIFLLDSDDWIDCRCIEKLYNLIKTRDADIAMCDFSPVFSNNIEQENADYKIFEYTNLEALYEYIWKNYIQIVISCGKLFNKKLFMDIRFPTGKYHEDEYTTHQLIYKSKKVVFSTEKLYYYLKRSDSITGSGYNLKKELDFLEAYEKRAEFFRLIGLHDISAETYKRVIRYYISNINRTVKNERKVFIQKCRMLNNNLKRVKFNFKFVILYKLFYIEPNLISHLYNKYNKFKIMEQA
ncbi:MAG: glycosyltransferase, partial [Hungateiclostridium thermocellum]|nr:glycosyltransferase [Acetivibrio thermocellus]